MLFITETFTDGRLVGTLPSSIGKFGSDADNWVSPHHTGDFSLFKIYADKNNRIVPWANDNVPCAPKQFLPQSLLQVNAKNLALEIYTKSKLKNYAGLKELITGDT